MGWPTDSLGPHWTEMMERATPRERELFGFPAIGDPYLNDQTLLDVQCRYPRMDMTPSSGGASVYGSSRDGRGAGERHARRAGRQRVGTVQSRAHQRRFWKRCRAGVRGRACGDSALGRRRRSWCPEQPTVKPELDSAGTATQLHQS